MSLRIACTGFRAAAHFRCSTPPLLSREVRVASRTLHSSASSQTSPSRNISIAANFPVSRIPDVQAIAEDISTFFNKLPVFGMTQQPSVIVDDAEILEFMEKPSNILNIHELMDSHSSPARREEIASTPFNELSPDNQIVLRTALSELLLNPEEDDDLKLVIVKNLCDWIWKTTPQCEVLSPEHIQIFSILEKPVKDAMKLSIYPGDVSVSIYENLLRHMQKEPCIVAEYFKLRFTPDELDYFGHLITGDLPKGTLVPSAKSATTVD